MQAGLSSDGLRAEDIVRTDVGDEREHRISYSATETIPCQDCGGMTIPTGSCTTCIQCGSTNGCG